MTTGLSSEREAKVGGDSIAERLLIFQPALIADTDNTPT
jgi:hypothetical protein